MAKGVKEYKIKINGVTQSVTDVTKLEDVLKRLDKAMQKTQGYNITVNGATQSAADTTRLEESIARLNRTTAQAGAATENASRASRERNAAIAEEERAERRLSETIGRAAHTRSDANIRQIEATTALREVTREVTRQVQINAQADGSVRQIGLRLNQLRNEYYNLSAAERENWEVGGKMLVQIRQLDEEYKKLKESAGQFQDSVGNYGRALEGLGRLSGGIEGASQSAMGFAQTMASSNQLMAMFGANTEENAEQAANLQKAMLGLAVVQGVNTNLLKSNIVTTILSTAADRIHMLQVRARATAIALSTKNTIAATAAQKVFNAVSKANPYVLLASAAVAAAGAIGAYIYKTRDAKDATDEASESVSRFKSELDGTTWSTQEAADAHDDMVRKIQDVQVDIDLANEKITEYQANLQRLSASGKEAFIGINKELKKNLDEIDKEYNGTLSSIQKWYFEIAGIMDSEEKERAGYLSRLQKWAFDVAGVTASVEREQAEQIKKQSQAYIEHAKELGYNALYNWKQYEKEQAQHNKRLRDENKKSSGSTRKDTADTLKKETELIRKAEDDKTALIFNEFERRRVETTIKYSRMRDDLQKQIDEDKTLTEKGRQALRDIINNIDARIAADRDKIRSDEENAEKEAEDKRKELLNKRLGDERKRNELLLSRTELDLEKATAGIGEIISRQKNGLQLIDITATRANLAEADKALDEYIKGLERAQTALKESHEKNLSSLKEGTPEYEEALQEYETANLELNTKLQETNKQREENTKTSNDLITEYFRELFEKIAVYAEAASTAISSVLDTFSMNLEVQIEDLNESLGVVNERYEEVKKLREDAVKRSEELEKQLQNATGGTALALREQLNREMEARNELDKEEKRLAKEKEKREAEIAKKEKQIKKNNLISDIAGAVAGVARSVIQALGLIFPLNLFVAGVVGAMGAAQVGIMTRQLSKMEDGGLIKGPSHSEGGARIHGTNIEVEGGEYVVNKRSTAANSDLVEFINNARRTVTLADLTGVIPGVPVSVSDAPVTGEDRILQAIENIEFSPVVAVTDILDASETVTAVRDISGY